MDAARAELRKLWDNNDPLLYAVSTWMDLRDKCCGTPWGTKLDDAAWRSLFDEMMNDWSVAHIHAQMAAFEADEEHEIRSRLGGYYAWARGLEKGDHHHHHATGENDYGDDNGGEPMAAGGKAALLDEIESRLSRLLPSVKAVRERLGEDAAQNYRADLEQLECRGVQLSVQSDLASAEQDRAAWPRGPLKIKVTRKSCRSHELRELTQLVSLAAIADPDDRVEAYIRSIQAQKRSRQERRVELKERNEWAIKRARGFGIWFCYAKDEPKWLADPSTREAAPIFLALVRRARRKLANQRCILQYIPKRRLTKHASKELLANITNLVTFLRRENI